MKICPLRTFEIIKDIFSESSKTVIEEISSLFKIVDEEPLTFFLIYNFKKLICTKSRKIIDELVKDILDGINKHNIGRIEYPIRDNLRSNLVVDIIHHTKHFEGSRSKSDFGLIVSYPIIEYTSGHIEISMLRNGILVQAKRNALNLANLNYFGKLSDSTETKYEIIKEFYTLALYEYEERNSNIELNQISFVTLESYKNTKNFPKKVNSLLSKMTSKKIKPADFLDLLMRQEIGTQNEKYIEKYILDQERDVFEIRISFKDNGGGFKAMVNQIMQEEQKQETHVHTIENN